MPIQNPLTQCTLMVFSIFSSDLDHSFDDDCDGKLVIAEHEDDLDIKAGRYFFVTWV